MRCMDRNRTPFYYALYETRVEIEDDYGNKTGQYELSYGNPIRCKANISAAMGETQSRQFGDSISYDKVLVLDKPTTDIDEYAVLWIDVIPQINTDGTTDTPHDYIVKKVARSLNSVSIAVSKVNVR